MRTFVHLSDIHFHNGSGSPYDLDVEVRIELQRDLKEIVEQLGGCSGILVSGDIAYSGSSDEYVKATAWLIELCKLLELNRSNVWVTPGNHDVSRTNVNEVVKVLHNDLRRLRPNEIDRKIASGFLDPMYKKLLLYPIENYIKFAGAFGCELGTESQSAFWQYDLSLNDGSILRLRGLNSTLVSDENDNDAANKLIVGEHQVQFIQEPNVVYLTLCHHPPDWLLDKDKISNRLNTQTRIQLFGHKHSPRPLRLGQGVGGDTLIFSAGAVHPEREDDDWNPYYNIFSVEVEGQNDSRCLKVLLYPREWSKGENKFVTAREHVLPDKDYIAYSLPLSNWENIQAQVPFQDPQMDTQMDNEAIKDEPEDTACDKQLIEYPARSLAYRFLTLQYHQITKIVSDLDLISDEDEGLHNFELYQNIFRKAESQGKLDLLWEYVEAEHNDNYYSYNPFRQENQGA